MRMKKNTECGKSMKENKNDILAKVIYCLVILSILFGVVFLTIFAKNSKEYEWFDDRQKISGTSKLSEEVKENGVEFVEDFNERILPPLTGA